MEAETARDKNIVKQILTYIPGSIVPALISIVTTTIFTRVFSAAEYGLFSLFLMIATTFRLVTTMWLIPSSARDLSAEQSEEGRRKIKAVVQVGIWVILCGDAVLGTAALLFLQPLLGAGQQSLMLPMIAYVMASSVFEVVNSLFTAEMRAKEYVSFKLTDSLVTLGLRLLFVLTAINMDVRAMFWSVFISAAVLSPLMWAKAGIPPVTIIFREIQNKLNWSYIIRLLKYGLPMTFWFFSSTLLDGGARYVLQYYLGPREVGIYDANYRMIGGTVSLLLVPAVLSLHPYLISISATGNKRKIGQVIEFILEKMLILGLAAVGLVLIFHKDIAYLLVGPEFREGSGIMPIALAGIVIGNMGSFTHKPFEIEKKLKWMLVMSVISAVANLILNFMMVPWMGYMGSALATLASYVIYALGTAALGRRLIDWHIGWRKLAPYFMAISAGVSAIFFLRRAIEKYSYVAGLGLALVLACLLGFLVVKLSFKWSSSLVDSKAKP